MNFSKESIITECTYKASRSSGKGGQHVNKTESRISLFFNVSNSEVLSEKEKFKLLSYFKTQLSTENVLQIDVEEKRSQHQNKKIAQDRFFQLIIKGLQKKKKRKPTKPTKAAIRKRLKVKKQQAEKKGNRKKDFL